jgi:hypothetical protein
MVSTFLRTRVEDDAPCAGGDAVNGFASRRLWSSAMMTGRPDELLLGHVKILFAQRIPRSAQF